MKNLELITYSLLHREAFKLIAEKYCKDYFKKEIMQRAKEHDIDKVILYTFLEKPYVSSIHRNSVSHHITKDNTISNKTELDFLEMVIDWECARYTKADKPLNAYQTLYAYFPELEPYVLPILKKFGLDNDDCTMDTEILKKISNIKISNDFIENIILDYIRSK